jgi:hypothetical protein
LASFAPGPSAKARAARRLPRAAGAVRDSGTVAARGFDCGAERIQLLSTYARGGCRRSVAVAAPGQRSPRAARKEGPKDRHLLAGISSSVLFAGRAPSRRNLSAGCESISAFTFLPREGNPPKGRFLPTLSAHFRSCRQQGRVHPIFADFCRMSPKPRLSFSPSTCRRTCSRGQCARITRRWA